MKRMPFLEYCAFIANKMKYMKQQLGVKPSVEGYGNKIKNRNEGD